MFIYGMLYCVLLQEELRQLDHAVRTFTELEEECWQQQQQGNPGT
jgi:hypothetical protein